MNGKCHELGTGSLRKSYGPRKVNDPHILTIEIEFILHPVLISDYWKIINLSKVFVIPEDLTVKGSIGLNVRIKEKYMSPEIVI